MVDYMVLFDSDYNGDYVPPDGIKGGVIGASDHIQIAVYSVPRTDTCAFEMSLFLFNKEGRKVVRCEAINP
jgi:hypothetical protein